MKLKAELSVAEQLMFTKLGFSHLFEVDINPLSLYRMVVEKAFINNETGEAIEALRKAFGRLENCQYRGCLQHDNVIMKALEGGEAHV